MTDRELLALAAKAAGIPVVWDEEAGCYLRQDRMGTVPWVPLTDDGDALRLAVYLDFGIEVHQSLGAVYAGNGIQEKVSMSWPLKGLPDAYSATRLAIVMAAAYFEKAKP
jgi:hypothetical protein